MVKVKLRLTKAGKNRFVVNSSSTQALRKKLKVEKNQHIQAKLKIGKKTFIINEKVEKKRDKRGIFRVVRRRIPIPSDVARNLKSGDNLFEVKKLQRGDHVTRRVFYPTAEKRGSVYTEYFLEPIVDINQEILKNEIFTVIRLKSKRHFVVNSTLNFLIHKDDGSVQEMSMSSPIQEGLSVKEEPSLEKQISDSFISGSFDTAFRVLVRDYVVEVYFVSYSVQGKNLITVKI